MSYYKNNCCLHINKQQLFFILNYFSVGRGKSLFFCVCNPLVSCCKRCFAIECVKPLIYASTWPCVHHNSSRCFRNIIVCSIYCLSVNVPCDMVRLPVKTVCMEAFGSVKSEVIHKFVITYTVCIVVELYLCSVFTENFDIDFIPRIIL